LKERLATLPLAETDPITSDEWLIRLVWHERVTDRDPVIAPSSFEPRANEPSGISLYRLACLTDPADALKPFPDVAKRDRYAIVLVSVALIERLGFRVQPDLRPDVPGHVLIPGININSFKADRRRFRPILIALATEASVHIIRRPLV